MMNKIEKCFEEFLKNPGASIIGVDKYDQAFRYIKTTIRDCENKISWEFIRENIIKPIGYRRARAQILISTILFTIKLDECGLLTGKNKGLFAKYKDNLTYYFTTSVQGKRELVETDTFSPSNIVVPPAKTDKTRSRHFRLFVIPNLSDAENEFIMQYLSSLDDSLMESRLRRGAAEVFSILKKHDILYVNGNEYNDKTFKNHFDIIKDSIPPEKVYADQTWQDACLSELVNFYYWLETSLDEEIRKKNFKIFTLPVFKYQYFTNSIKSGFAVVHYSIYDNPPEADKWIINPQNMSLHQTAEADKLTSLDLSWIQNIHLKKWVKECYWFDSIHCILYL